jgi:hypothetical protein
MAGLVVTNDLQAAQPGRAGRILLKEAWLADATSPPLRWAAAQIDGRNPGCLVPMAKVSAAASTYFDVAREIERPLG